MAGVELLLPAHVAAALPLPRPTGVRRSDGAALVVDVGGFTALSDNSTTKCHGVPATITGTSAAQTINGTAGNDVIVALGGGDTGNGGDDIFCGGPGNDRITTGTGNDLIVGQGDVDNNQTDEERRGALTLHLCGGTAALSLSYRRICRPRKAAAGCPVSTGRTRRQHRPVRPCGEGGGASRRPRARPRT